MPRAASFSWVLPVRPIVPFICLGLLPVLGCAKHKPLSAVEVVDRAVSASGGRSACQQLHQITWKGRSQLTGPDGNVITTDEEWFALGTDRVRVNLVASHNNKSIAATIAMNGRQVWGKIGECSRETPPEKAVVLRDIFRAYRLLHSLPNLTETPFELILLGESKMEGQDLVRVRVLEPNEHDAVLFFDSNTGLPAKVEVEMRSATGMPTAIEVLVSDYKSFRGLNHFTHLTVRHASKVLWESDLVDLKLHELDGRLFEKP